MAAEQDSACPALCPPSPPLGFVRTVVSVRPGRRSSDPNLAIDSSAGSMRDLTARIRGYLGGSNLSQSFVPSGTYARGVTVLGLLLDAMTVAPLPRPPWRPRRPRRMIYRGTGGVCPRGARLDRKVLIWSAPVSNSSKTTNRALKKVAVAAEATAPPEDPLADAPFGSTITGWLKPVLSDLFLLPARIQEVHRILNTLAEPDSVRGAVLAVVPSQPSNEKKSDEENEDSKPNVDTKHGEAQTGQAVREEKHEEAAQQMPVGTDDKMAWLGQVLRLLDHGQQSPSKATRTERSPTVDASSQTASTQEETARTAPNQSSSAIQKMPPNTCTTHRQSTTTPSKTMSRAVERLRALAVLGSLGRARHAANRKIDVYCSSECPMRECQAHHFEFPTSKVSTEPADQPSWQTVDSLENKRQVLTDDARAPCVALPGSAIKGCARQTCPRSSVHPHCSCCIEAAMEGRLLVGPDEVSCPTCEVTRYCSSECLERDREAHQKPTSALHPLSVQKSSIVPSACERAWTRVEMTVKTLQFEALHLLAASGSFPAPAPAPAPASRASAALKRAAQAQFYFYGRTPLSWIAHYIAKRMQGAPTATHTQANSAPPSPKSEFEVHGALSGHASSPSVSALLQLATWSDRLGTMGDEDGHAMLDEIIEYIAVERFLESNFTEHTMFFQEIRSRPKLTDANSNAKTKTEDAGFELGGRQTSESTLRLFGGLTDVSCVGCHQACASRRQLWACPDCGLATCCENCAPSVHLPYLCSFIVSLLDCALTNRVNLFHQPL